MTTNEKQTNNNSKQHKTIKRNEKLINTNRNKQKQYTHMNK